MLQVIGGASHRAGRRPALDAEIRRALGVGVGASVPFSLGAMRSGRQPGAWDLVSGAFAAWRADLDVSVSGAAVTSWLDQISRSATLSQGVGAQQPTLTASDANLGGQAALTFDGTDDNLSSSLAASSWNFLHNGAGAAVLCVCRPTKTTGAANRVWWTSNTTSSRGAKLRHNASSDRFEYAISDGATDVISVATGTGAAEPVSVAVLTTHETAATPDAELRHPPGTVIGSGSGTPSAGAAASTLIVSHSTTSGFGGAIAELVVWNRNLTAGEITTIAAYTLARYGC